MYLRALNEKSSLIRAGLADFDLILRRALVPVPTPHSHDTVQR